MFSDKVSKLQFATVMVGALLTLGITTSGTAAAFKPAYLLNSYGANDNSGADESEPRVDFDESGNAVAMWIAPGSEVPFGRHGRLAFASMQSGTSAWSTLPDPTPEGSGAVLNIDLISAGENTWVAAWLERSPLNEDVYAIHVMRSHDLANSWSEADELYSLNINFGSINADIQLASDGNGRLLLMWAEHGSLPGHSYRILKCGSEDYGQSWSSPQEISIPGETVSGAYARITYDTVAGWLMAYSSGEKLIPGPGGFNFPVNTFSVAQSSDFGISWANIGPVFDDPVDKFSDFPFYSDAGRTVLAINRPVTAGPPDNNIYINGIAVYIRDDTGTTFTGPLWLESPQSTKVYLPHMSLSADEEGNWILVTAPSDESALKVWHSSDPKTTWTVNSDIAGGVNSNYVAAGYGDQQFSVAAEHRPTSHTFGANDTDIIGFQLDAGGNAWTDTGFVNASAVSDEGNVFDKNISMDAGNGLVIAGWIANPDHYRDEASPETAMISRSTNDGRSWGPAQPLPISAPEACEIHYQGSDNWKMYWETSEGQYSSIESNDNGLTWSSPIAETAMPGYDLTQAVGGSARIRVSSEVVGGSGDSNYVLNTYAETSLDSGATWQPKKLVHSEEREPMFNASDYQAKPSIVFLDNQRFGILVKNVFFGRDTPLEINYLTGMNLYYVETDNNGETWQAPETIAIAGENDSPDTDTAFTASNGAATVAYSRYAWPGRPDWGSDADILFRHNPAGAPNAATDWALFE